MTANIESVGVLGAGTMGAGIAALCASVGCRVVLLDVTRAAATAAIERMTQGRAPALDDPDAIARITPGSLADDLEAAAGCDWICEAIIEDLDAKRALFEQLEPRRRDGTVVSTNTSGIPLHAITAGMPERLRRAIAVTHFFNPVKVMKLVELVPGSDTAPEVRATFADFLADRLGKGVVHAKDTVNFIGNRIGCFWMLAGLQAGAAAIEAGLSQEEVDALLSAPMGIPPTGLYGLIDLVGLDIMDLVAKNLEANLPGDDAGRAFTRLPAAERAMLAAGQLGRKTGGGFYRVTKNADGSRAKETFDLATATWRPARAIQLSAAHSDLATLMFADDQAGRFVRDAMGATLAYAADLVPEIADDIVNVDRAMRWGFAWRRGPFQLLDDLDPARVSAWLRQAGRPVPKMLAVLAEAGAPSFYRAEGGEYLGVDGHYHPVA